jgi:hypothetical protein
MDAEPATLTSRGSGTFPHTSTSDQVHQPSISAMAGPFKLTYFNMTGRAEPIRLAFAYGGIAFEVGARSVHGAVT